MVPSKPSLTLQYPHISIWFLGLDKVRFSWIELKIILRYRMDFWWAFIYVIYLMKNLIWTNWPSIHESFALVTRERM